MLKIAHCEILCVNKRRSRRVHRQHTMCTCHVWLCMCHIFAAFCEGHGPQKLLTSCAGPDSLKFNWTQSDSTDRFGLTHCSHHEFFFFFFSFFWVLFLIYFLTFYLILHVSTVTEELYKTNWHITLPCRCCQMCSMIHCRGLGIQGSVLLQIMSRTISKASLVVWILHFCLVLKWYSLHRYSTRHCQQLIVCSRFKGRDCTLLNKEVWVISSHWNSAYIRVWLEVLLV